MDNALAFSNLIINDLIEGADELVLTVDEYAQLNMCVDNFDYLENFDDEMSKAEN